MFKGNTLFVVGAGASHEAGLPLGAGLAEVLANDLYLSTESGRLEKGDQQVFSEIYRIAKSGDFDQRTLIGAGRIVAAGVRDAESIDNFLDLHTDKPAVQLVAKIGIAVAIAKAERDSRLFQFSKQSNRWIVREGHDPNCIRPRDTWYQKFFEIAKDQVRSSQLEKLFEEVRLICFNYDRTLEHFLLHKVQSLYAVDEGQASRAVSQLKVIRPYGWLGPLPQLNATNSMPYGEVDHTSNFWAISQNIRTYSELPGSETKQQISEAMSWAKQIVFLGFGFHRQNMNLLKRRATSGAHVYATTHGISGPNQVAIKQRIHEAFGGHFALNEAWQPGSSPTLSDLRCGDFMSEYREILKS